MLYLGIGLFLAYIYLCFQLANSVMSPPRRVADMPDAFKEVEIVPGSPAWVSPDLETKDEVFVMSHGLGGDRGFFADTAIALQKKGYGVVLTAMPGQDTSKIKTIGFGTLESEVIKKTLDALKAKKIVIVGCSMGGAATWMASDHPKVAGIVTEGAYSRLGPVTKEWLKAKIPGGDIVFAPVIWIATWKLGIRAGDINPVEFAEKWDRSKPAVVIQAENDSLIPRVQADELAKASGAEYWVVKGVGHANCQDERDTYLEKLVSVMNDAKP
jgi:pimeloyl-ACP methyl ester carboxylesterase